MQKELTEYLSTFVTPERLTLFETILEHRTSYFTVVLEDIYQSQNASAVLRTCDCFGIQNVNVIENRNSFTVNKEVSLGSSKWLSIRKFTEGKNNSLEAIQTLKKEGFRIVATSPHTNDTLLDDFDIEKGKAAFVFGSELPGISETIMNEADEFVKIPMFGFTESFNISVSAAIILHHLTDKLHKNPEIHWKLTSEEKAEIRLQWLRKTIKRSDLLEQLFARQRKQPG
ncbi:MAG TPA: RNA methyltransferase [Tangfeifania sp.]|nr:RNA methyltransferase [Tangfeifania sp.]